MKLQQRIAILGFVIMAFTNCNKELEIDVNKQPEPYLIAGDTINCNYYAITPEIIISRIRAINPMVTSLDTLLSNFDEYYFDSDSLDINHDNIIDLAFNHTEGSTCNSKRYEQDGSVICLSEYGLCGKRIVSTKKEISITEVVMSKSIINAASKWNKVTSILPSWDSVSFIGVQIISKDTTFGWIRFKDTSDSLIIKDFALMKK